MKRIHLGQVAIGTPVPNGAKGVEMYKVLSTDDKDDSAVILYNGKKYQLWRDWHEGHIKCWDDDDNSYFIGEYKYEWKNDEAKYSEFYRSKEFEEGFIRDRSLDERYIREGKTRLAESTNSKTNEKASNEGESKNLSKAIMIGGGLAAAAYAIYNYLKKD